jgi:hypothetical protein
MAVQGYTGKFIAAKITATVGGATVPFSGLADLNIQWQRPITMTKMLDETSPVLVKGKTQGRITLSGFATSSVADIAATANMTATADSGETKMTVPPAEVTVTLAARAINASADKTVQYVGYLTGQGIQFRKVADRMWVMDGTAIISLVD